MTLYCFGESGNAYKAALTLELAGVDWTENFVDFFKGEARSDAFKAINPMGEVPVLVDANGLQPTQIGNLPPQLASICRSRLLKSPSLIRSFKPPPV